MRRPNPWIAVPSILLGLLAGMIGWVVTDVSCRPESCSGWAAALAALAFLTVTVSVAIVLALVYRSIAEWRDDA